MTRLNTEYFAKLQYVNERRVKLKTDAAIFKDELQKQRILEKELDGIE